MLVVVLLDGSGDGTTDAEAVAAHQTRPFGALGVEKCALHRCGVLGAELEDVADLDAAGLGQSAVAAAGARVACAGGVQVHHLIGSEVAPGNHAHQMGVGRVGASGGHRELHDRGIGEHRQASQSHWA